MQGAVSTTSRQPRPLDVAVLIPDALQRLDFIESLTQAGMTAAAVPSAWATHHWDAHHRDARHEDVYCASMADIRAQRPDVLVVDYYGRWTPVAHACLEATIQENLAPVVVTSAYNDSHFVQMAIDGGAVGYLVKPWTDREIVSVVRSADEDRRMRRRLVESMLDVPRGLKAKYYTRAWVREMLRQGLVHFR